MGPGAAGLIGAGAGLALASAFCALIFWAGPLDAPRARGLHDNPTVTSGGLAVLAGTGAGLAIFSWLVQAPAAGLSAVAVAVGFAGALGLLGALDDLIDVGAKLKLGVQAVLGLVFAIMVARIDALPLGGSLVLPMGFAAGALGTTLWFVVAANAVNFMDGADGLAAGSLAIVLAAIGLAGVIWDEPAVGGAALAAAGALVGFLPWNLPFRRLFQGDVGALFSGFLAASLAVIAAGRLPVYFVPFLMIPFLTDVLLTLAIRARRGARLFEAHRDHLYQLWLRTTGRPHRAVTVRVWAVMGVYAIGGLAMTFAPSALHAPIFAAGVVAAAIGWRTARRRLEAPAV